MIKCSHEECAASFNGSKDQAIDRGWLFITGRSLSGGREAAADVALCKDHTSEARRLLEASGVIERRIQE